MPSEFSTRLFAIVDSTDVTAFADLCTDDASLTFANAEPLTGRAAIVEGLGAFYTTIAGLRHEVARELTVGSDTLVEATVTYTRLDGALVTIPAATVIHRDDSGLIDQYRVYFDTTPVYA